MTESLKIYDQCVSMLQKANRDTFLCCVISSGGNFYYFCTLFLFNIEISNIFYKNSEHSIFQNKLTWWKWQIDIIYNNKNKENNSILLETPLIKAMDSMIKKTNLPKSMIIDYLNAYETFCYKRKYFTLGDLELFAKNTYGTLVQMLCFVQKIENITELSTNTGIAIGLTMLLTNEGFNNNSYLPFDTLRTCGLKQNLVLEKAYAPLKQEAINIIVNKITTHIDISCAIMKNSKKEQLTLLPNLLLSLSALKKIKATSKFTKKRTNFLLFTKIAIIYQYKKFLCKK